MEDTSTVPILHDSVGSTDGVRLADGRIDVVIDGEELGVWMGPELDAKDGADTGELLGPKLGPRTACWTIDRAADGLTTGELLGMELGGRRRLAGRCATWGCGNC
jgi:hypothetical protein